MAIPKTEAEFKLVERLTKEAVLKAVERHAGIIRYIYGPSGRSTVAEGKEMCIRDRHQRWRRYDDWYRKRPAESWLCKH